MRRTFTLIAIAANYAAAIRNDAPVEMTEEVVAPEVVENAPEVAPAGESAAPDSNPEAEQAILATIDETLNKPIDAQNSQPGGLTGGQPERKE